MGKARAVSCSQEIVSSTEGEREKATVSSKNGNELHVLGPSGERRAGAAGVRSTSSIRHPMALSTQCRRNDSVSMRRPFRDTFGLRMVAWTKYQVVQR